MVLVLAFYLIAETGGKILFVADHHIDIAAQLAVYFLGFGRPADRSPERIAKVEVVRDDRAVLFGRFHRFLGDFGGRFRERAEDPPGMKPPGAFLTEYLFPIDIALFKL